MAGGIPDRSKLEGLPILDFARAIRLSPIEIGAFFREGVMVDGPFFGGESGIDLPADLRFAGTDCVHNHPRSTSISMEDLAFARECQLRSMCIVCSNLPMIQVQAIQGWLTDEQILQNYDFVAKMLLDEYIESIDLKQMAVKGAMEKHLFSNFARRFAEQTAGPNGPYLQVEEVKL